jgi:hypothetical protein
VIEDRDVWASAIEARRLDDPLDVALGFETVGGNIRESAALRGQILHLDGRIQRHLRLHRSLLAMGRPWQDVSRLMVGSTRT